ncbi:MAG: T9SS type A sorting domain-containing protein, partial [Rhodothermales bacterium]
GRGGDGFAFGEGFGPYVMAPGEDVRIIIAEGIGGISDAAAVHVGRAYKRANGDENLLSEFDANGDGVISDAVYDYNTLNTGAERMTKNEWSLSAKDTMFQTFERIKANYESGWNIPKGPMPPARFSVTSQTDQILVEWESYPGESPAGGWELWRAQNRFDGLPIDPLLGTPFEEWPTVYKLAGTFPAGTTSYEDAEVIRGINYYYYLQAVGDVNNDATGNTPVGVPLKSNRYWAQTYEPARLKRPPGANISDARVVPNPYNVNTEQSLLFSNRDLMAFFNIPGQSTIKIYTEMGELIRTLEQTDGSGDKFWDMQTESLQLVSTGIYLAVITDNETGEKVTRKFTIIR